MADKPSTTSTTDVAVFNPEESNFPALFVGAGEGGSIAEVIEDNFGDEGFSVSDLDRVKIPAGGGLTWEVPDEEPTRSIAGIIIHKQATRSFWFKKRGENGEDDGPPDCYSVDAKVGVGSFGPGSEGNPSGACGDCPMNVFGSSTSGSGAGKACKEQMQVFVLQPDAVLPLQLSLPPTSLRGFRRFMTRLASKGKSYYSVVTGFGLEVTKSGGQTYSTVVPSKIADLSREEAQAARDYGQTIRTFLDEAAAERARNDRQDGADEPAGTTAGGDVWRSDDAEPAPAPPAGAGG